MYMKKRIIIAVIMVTVMLASCGKDAVKETDETKEREETSAAAVEETSEATETSATSEEPTSEPTPEPTSEPAPEPIPDEIAHDGSQYELLMKKIDEIEEANPGSTYSFHNRYDTIDYWQLDAAYDGMVHVYAIFDGEVKETYCYEVDPEYYYGLDYDTVRSFPFIIDISTGWYLYIGCGELTFEPSLPDGIYNGTVYGFSEDRKYMFVEYGHYVKFEEDYIKGLKEGDTITLDHFNDLEVIGCSEDFIQLNDYLGIRNSGLSNVYDDSYYLADNDYACCAPEGFAVVEIAPDCKILEAKNSYNEHTLEVVSGYSGEGLKNSYYGERIGEAPIYELGNNGWSSVQYTEGDVTQFKVSGGKVTEMNVEYYYGI